MSDPLNHLGSIWYHSNSLEVPYSPNQFLGWNFFCHLLQQTGSSLRNISSCLKVGISVAPDFWQTGAENESTFVGNCGKRSNFQAFNENMNLRKPIHTKSFWIIKSENITFQSHNCRIFEEIYLTSKQIHCKYIHFFYIGNAMKFN